MQHCRILVLAILFSGLSLHASCVPKKSAPDSSASSASREEIARLKKEKDAEFFQRYAGACTESLGEIPAVSCVPNGKDSIELVALGKPDWVPDETPPEFAGVFMEKGHGCVNPAWIAAGERSFGCSSKQVISRKTLKNPRGESVDWVTLCREPKRDTSDKGFKIANFMQIGVIGYNQTTGDTCFFNIGPKGTRAGAQEFPAPSAPAAAEVYDSVRFANWMEACTSCHALGPWIHSPLVNPEVLHERLASTDLVTKLEGNIQKEFFSKPKPLHPDGRPFVPSNFRVEGKKPVPVPYRIVYQNELRDAALEVTTQRKEHVWSPRFFPEGTAPYCESCHRVPIEIQGQVSLMLSRPDLRGGMPYIGDLANKPPAPYDDWHSVFFAKLNGKKVDEIAEPLTKARSELIYK